jgi:hypothetical protein
MITSGKAIYGKLQDLQGNIKTARDQIEKLGLTVDLQQRAYPARLRILPDSQTASGGVEGSIL